MSLVPSALVVKSLLALEWEGLVSFLDCWTASVCADPASILFQVNLVHVFLAHGKVLYTTKNSCTSTNLILPRPSLRISSVTGFVFVQVQSVPCFSDLA